MKRQLFLIVVAVLLVVASWSVGRAQTNVAPFEIAVEGPRGLIKVTCSRGCDWPADEGTLLCETERCQLMFNGHGRILLGQPR